MNKKIRGFKSGMGISKTVIARPEYARIQDSTLQVELEHLDNYLEGLLILARQEDKHQAMNRESGASDDWEHKVMRCRWLLAFD